MKILNEISDKSLGLSDKAEQLGTEYTLRKSGRALLFNEAGEVATQYLENYTYHKLPGGGVDPGETEKEAADREVEEEVGCKCRIVDPIGVVIEYRDKYKLLHLSYAYVAEVEGELGTPALEEGEIEEGQVTKWMKPEVLLQKMENDQPQKYEGYFILEREKSILRAYLNKE